MIVSRTTLHNEDEIKRKDVRIGDTVNVRRAGDVIPEIVNVVDKDTPDRGQPFTMPDVCPVCGGEVHRQEMKRQEGVLTLRVLRALKLHSSISFQKAA